MIIIDKHVRELMVTYLGASLSEAAAHELWWWLLCLFELCEFFKIHCAASVC
jgi:hypothetical protein